MKEPGRYALLTVGAVGAVGAVLWWLGADWLAGASAEPWLTCRVDSLATFSGTGLVLWRFGSLLLFLLAAGLLPLLLTRGRCVVAAGACVALAGLITWGHVAATHAVMRYSVEHGTLNALPQDARGVVHDPCEPRP